MKQFGTVEEYISIQEKSIIQTLIDLRKAIVEAAPQAIEKISYGMPTFHYKENIIHFAAYKNHIGIYPTPSAIIKFSNELKDYKTSKGAIQFPIDKKLDLDLIKKMVLFRLKEIDIKHI
mgnify:CR=1 FL=1